MQLKLAHCFTNLSHISQLFQFKFRYIFCSSRMFLSCMRCCTFPPLRYVSMLLLHVWLLGLLLYTVNTVLLFSLYP